MNMAAAENNSRVPEIATLGDGDVFVKRTPSGIIKSVKGSVLLREELGQIAEVSGKFMITAAGYNEMNKIASLSIITPKTLTLPDGDIVVNPYPIIDPVSKSIEKVWVKKMSVGYSPIGNMVIVATTLLYDITMYYLQDLAKKIQYSKDAGKVTMGAMLTEEERKKGTFHPIQGDLGLWVDYTHKDVLKALDTFIQNKLFAERKAQTICERNAMKKHPALSTVNVIAQGNKGKASAKVNVIGFCHDFNEKELLDLAERAEAAGEELEMDNGQKVQVIEAESTTISEEDITSSQEDEENIPSAEEEFEVGTGGSNQEGRKLF